MSSILEIMESKTEIVVAEDIVHMLYTLDDAEEVIKNSIGIINLHAALPKLHSETTTKGEEVLEEIAKIKAEWDTALSDEEDEAPPTPAQIATPEKITVVRASAGGCSLEHIRTKPSDKAPPTAAEVARMSTAEKVAWMRSGMRKPYIPGKTDG